MAHRKLTPALQQLKFNIILKLLAAGSGLLFVLQFLAPAVCDYNFPPADLDKIKVNWDQYKYVQIVTTPEDLCSAVMIWAKVEEYGSRASRIMLYPSEWDVERANEKDIAPSFNSIARLLRKASQETYVGLRPTDSLNSGSNSPWLNPSYTKLLAFNLTDFFRALVLDPAVEYRGNMDELYLLPKSKVSMPYMHAENATARSPSSRLFLVSPSTSNFAAIEKAVKNVKIESSVVEIVQKVFPSNIGRIPDKIYGFTTSELRRNTHPEYLSVSRSKWDPDKVFSKVKMIHYSDYPLPSPWIKAPQELLNKQMPKCVKSEWFGASNCRSRELWFELYANYAMKRRAICGSEFEVKNMVNESSGES